MLNANLLITALNETGVEFVVSGGMAAIAQGSAYMTADLDICYRRERSNYEHLSRALSPFKPYLRGVPEGLPFALDAGTIQAGLNFTLTTTAGPLDLLGEIAGLGTYEAVKAHAESIELYGHTI